MHTWEPYEVGQGVVEIGASPQHPQRIRLSKEPYLESAPTRSAKTPYTNAQIDDYHTRRRADFLWNPPLRMSLRARFSHPAADVNSAVVRSNPRPYLTGTAGFGFWNDPFMMTGHRRPTLPRALWFFYSSPPSDMQLALDVPGRGWKVATIDCWRPAFYALLPTAPIGILLMRSRFLYRWLWPIAQAAMHVHEELVPLSLTEWRRYEIEWLPTSVQFWVDGDLVCQTKRAPRGPLGLVIWLDNQFMVVTPTGRFQSGLVETSKREFLEVEELRIVYPIPFG